MKIVKVIGTLSKILFAVKPPTKIPTPYGGKLIWTLPGKTRIVCHLKDKKKIRHKKRWSQVMYMYYLLGYLLVDNPKLSEDRKEVSQTNTNEYDTIFFLSTTIYSGVSISSC